MNVSNLRWVGNAFLIVGHFILLYVSLFWGLTICFASNAMILPWALKDKLWDVVIILCFFGAIEGSKLISLVI